MRGWSDNVHDGFGGNITFWITAAFHYKVKRRAQNLKRHVDEILDFEFMNKFNRMYRLLFKVDGTHTMIKMDPIGLSPFILISWANVIYFGLLRASGARRMTCSRVWASVSILMVWEKFFLISEGCNSSWAWGRSNASKGWRSQQSESSPLSNWSDRPRQGLNRLSTVDLIYKVLNRNLQFTTMVKF